MIGLARIAFVLGLGVAAAVALLLLGLQTEFAWAWGLLVTAIAVMVRLRAPDDPRADAPGRPEAKDYIGSDVSRLAWAINLQTGVVTEAVTRRVRATLRRRLARHGIDPDDSAQTDAVEAHLGEGLWARLNGHRTTIADVRSALAAAERLAPANTNGTTHQEDAT